MDSGVTPDANPPQHPPPSSAPDQAGASLQPCAPGRRAQAPSRDYPATEAQAPGESDRPSDVTRSPSDSGGPRKSAWDVVVVGGGIGGLAVAGLLAQAGRAVLLLEASTQLGGACLGMTWDGHRYDLGVGLLTGAGPGGAVGALCERLQISLPTMACDPALQVALARHRVDLSRSAEGWWPEIHREFPDDEAGWHELVPDLASLAADRDELARRLPPLPPDGWLDRFRCWRSLTLQRVTGVARPATRKLRSAAATPFHQALLEYGLGAASRQALEACLWYLLLRGADECSTLEAALALQRLREGLAVIPNGPMALADLLAQRTREHGGEIRLRTGAARCVAERGRIVGVTTTAGETIRARWVVTDVPPGVLMGELWPTARGVFRRRRPAQGPWEPRCIAQVLGMAIPEAYLPAELGYHCLVVGDAGRPARDENLVFVRRMTDGLAEGASGGLARLCVGRFVPPSASADGGAVARALLEALDRVIPGVESIAVHQRFAPASALAELWGLPMAAVRYTVDSRVWLGRRGLPHRVGWPGLLAVGEWTYPGRLISDVAEGAMRVADLIAAET
jgi:phytoene dehydrogenase-like protein